MGPHNIHSLPDQSLVRLRGTVQDLPNPELYLGVAKLPDGSLITTKFTDGVDAMHRIFRNWAADRAA